MGLLECTLSVFSDSEKQEDLDQCMLSYEQVNNTFYRDFFTLTLDDSPELDDAIKEMLDKLDVLPEQQSRYLRQKMTVYDFLVELNEHVENQLLADFIERLSKRKSARWKNIALASLLGSACTILPFFVFQLTVLQQVLSVASIISCGGLIYSVAVAAYAAYEANESRKSFYRLFQDHFFVAVKHALTVSAWTIMLTAAVTTPVVSILFVAADAVLVIQESLSLIYISLYENPSINPQSTLMEQHIQARELNSLEKRKYSTLVKLVAAILMTGIIAAWCFAPAGMLLTAGALLAIGVVYFSQQYVISHHDKSMRAELKESFVKIEQTENPNVEPSVTPSPEESTNAKLYAALTVDANVKDNLDKVLVAEPEIHASYDGLVENSIFSEHERHKTDSEPQPTSPSLR